MCLDKTHRLPKISRKPIKVYKVFRLVEDRLITPFQRQYCNIGETIKSKSSWIKGILKNKIEKEGVHAFINKREAEYFVDINSYFFHKMFIYLCEIPPFTPYWISEYDDIAASKMIIKEKVEI